MKKIFKGIAVLAATAAVGTGLAFGAGCSGKSGEYVGHYGYANEYNAVYGMVVKVTVKNNIIEKIEDVTHTYENGEGYSVTYTPVKIDWTAGGPQRDAHGDWLREGDPVTVYNKEWHSVSNPQGAWTEDAKLNWLTKENWLLQQYEGWSVADILSVKVFYDENGEPYSEADNPGFVESGLVLSGATQGSGRLLLAVQDALKNK